MSPVYTRDEVRKHNNEKNLWMVIHNNVYDVTKFLHEHPGGEDALKDFAGKDATVAFENVGHSDDARQLLEKYLIGSLPAGQHSSHALSCEKIVEEKTCTVCQVTSCPGLKKNLSPKRSSRTFHGTKDRCPNNNVSPKRSWRTFDGTPDRDRSKANVSTYQPPATPTVERRVQTIVVPKERPRIPRPPPPQGSKLKWLLLALGAAVVMGVVMKKYMT